MEEELAEIIYTVGDEGGDGEIKSAFLTFCWGEVGQFDTGEEEEGMLVVGGEITGDLMMVSVLICGNWQDDVLCSSLHSGGKMKRARQSRQNRSRPESFRTHRGACASREDPPCSST
jgi:hypothetical protein